MLYEKGLYGDLDKVEKAIERIRHFEPADGYYLAFSGGKDSVVLHDLTARSGVTFDAHYSVTTIDPPELVRFIRKQYPSVHWERPERPFLRRLEIKGFPQRMRRWCCELYKENGGDGRTVLTGIRREESYNRARRKVTEACTGKGGYSKGEKRYVNPILDWTSDEVWEYIEMRSLPYCHLYDTGWKRLGCLFCPMARRKDRRRALTDYPRHAALFEKSFEKLYQNRKAAGKASVDRWESGKDMFLWWVLEPPTVVPEQQLMHFE